MDHLIFYLIFQNNVLCTVNKMSGLISNHSHVSWFINFAASLDILFVNSMFPPDCFFDFRCHPGWIITITGDKFVRYRISNNS